MEGKIFSKKCNNPDLGFKIGKNNTQVAIAGQGYWVYTIKELDRLGK